MRWKGYPTPFLPGDVYHWRRGLVRTSGQYYACAFLGSRGYNDGQPFGLAMVNRTKPCDGLGPHPADLDCVVGFSLLGLQPYRLVEVPNTQVSNVIDR